MTHPAGVGSWRVWLRSRPLRTVIVGGHTAYDAYQNSLPFLTRNSDRSFGFADVDVELVSDSPPPPKPELPAKKSRKQKPPGRMVGAQRIAGGSR